MKIHNRNCFSAHMGTWLCMDRVLRSRLQGIKDGLIVAEVDDDASSGSRPELFTIVNDVAIIHVDDVMMKRRSKFGGVSTIEMRSAMRELADSGVKAVIFKIDSPGGHVEGQQALLEEVERLSAKKSVYAYVGDLACSAAYWLAASTGYICAARMALLANIGAYTVLWDTTEAQKMDGIKATLVKSGEKKGLGADGQVTKELKEEVQAEINAIHNFFVSDIKKFRPKWNGEKADGAVLFPEDALAAGLIDEISSFDAFLKKVVDSAGLRTPSSIGEKMEIVFKEGRLVDAAEASGAKADVASDEDTVVTSEVEDNDDPTPEKTGGSSTTVSIEDVAKARAQEPSEPKAEAPSLAMIAKELEADVQQRIEDAVARGAGEKIRELAKAAGINIENRKDSEIEAQLVNLFKTSSPNPATKSEGATKRDAFSKLRELQEEHGVSYGGVIFKRDFPELFKKLAN